MNYDEKSKIIHVPHIYKFTNSKGLGHAFFEQMVKNKHKIAQYVEDTNEQDTFDSLLGRCVRAALHLRSRQLGTNDIVCLCSFNHVNSCVPFIASQFNGNKVACLHPALNLADGIHMVKTVKPKIFFVSSDAVELIEKVIKEVNYIAEIVVFGKTELHTPFEEFLIEVANEVNFKPVDIENPFETAIVLSSSGTTGTPKAICLHHVGVIEQAITCACFLSMRHVLLNYAGLNWISGILSLTISTLNGAARVVCSKFKPDQLWHMIDTYKIHSVLMLPTLAIEMMKHGRPKDADTSSLRSIVTAGSPFSINQLQKLRNMLHGTTIFQVYGQTEIVGVVSMFNIEDESDQKLISKKPGSCGRPIPGIAYKVVDVETEQTCGPNMYGELRIKSKYLMNGFFNMESSDAYDSEGWFKTGDIMYFDEDFCFFITGRLKEMLKYKGWQVQPAVLEQVLLEHPAVKQAIVIGIPHEEDGDHPMALVKLNPSHNISANEIETFVAKRVDDRHQLRAGVKFVEHLPVTSTGKIMKSKIKEMVLMGCLYL